MRLPPMRISPILLLWILFIQITTVSAQREEPKIGLVLSGGAAKGFAHIGVLEYLEEHSIKVDYITGTSMGAIVGGLYAMGYSSQEIRFLAESQNWSTLLSNNIALYDVAPSEKRFHDKFLLTLETRNGALSLPQSAINSQNLELAITRMFIPAFSVTHFDELAHPFRCISVDIETGEVIVMDKGFLGHAVRASMAIPSVFEPKEIDGRLLVDGGLIRNFPVQEVRDLGADIVIGVYVGSRLESKENLNSMLDILGQSAFMMGILDSEEQKALTDVLIEPDVQNMESFGFDNLGALIGQGYLAAEKSAAVLSEFEKMTRSNDIKSQIRIPENIAISKTEFPETPQPFDELASFKFGQRKDSKTLPIDEIEEGILRIYGTKHFDNISYVLSESTNNPRLDILAQPTRQVSFSGGGNFFSTTNTSILLNSQLRNILNQPSVLNFTARLSENFGVDLSYDYRLGKKKDYLLQVHSTLFRNSENLYEVDILRRQMSRLTSKSTIGVAYEPNNYLLMGLSVGYNHYALKPKSILEDGFERFTRNDFVFKAYGIYNTTDKSAFPTEGWEGHGQMGYNSLLSTEVVNGTASQIFQPDEKNYAWFAGSLGRYIPLNHKFNWHLRVSAGWRSAPSLVDNYRIGGLENRGIYSTSMLGLNTHQWHFTESLNISTAIRVQLSERFYLSGVVGRQSGERAFFLNNSTDQELRGSFWSYGTILGIDTPLGPIKIGHGYNTRSSEWNFNFIFGYPLIGE